MYTNTNKSDINVIPESGTRPTTYHMEGTSKEKYSLFNDQCNNRVETQPTSSAVAGGSCAKAYTSQKNNSNKKVSCATQQNQFSTKYDINWMTSSEFKPTTPDFTLLAPYDYFTQPSNMALNHSHSHYTSAASFANFDGPASKKSDLYFAHPPGDENNLPWSPSKMTNLLDSTQMTGSQYFSSPLPNLHGDLALNTGSDMTKLPQGSIVNPNNTKEVVNSNKKGQSDSSHNNFLSVHQLMGNNLGSSGNNSNNVAGTTQNQGNTNNKVVGDATVKTVRTKAEKKSMPPSFTCDLNAFEQQRTYNYSAESLLSNNPSATNRMKPKVTAPVVPDSYTPTIHIDSYAPHGVAFESDQFYPSSAKCDAKMLNPSYVPPFVDNSFSNLQHGLYQPPNFNRNQIPSSSNSSINFTPNFAPFQSDGVHERKYLQQSQSLNNGINPNNGTSNNKQGLYPLSNCNNQVQQKPTSKLAQSTSTVKLKNRQQHSYFQEFPIFSQTDPNFSYHQSNSSYSCSNIARSLPSSSYVNFNLNQQGGDTGHNFGTSGLINHQNTHNTTGTSNLTNFNLSTICPEINDKVRQQNWQ